MQIAVETTVQAPREVVFAIVAGIADWPRAISGIRSVEMLTPGHLRVGTRFRETRVMFGREATEEMTIAGLDPPRCLLLTAFNHGTAYRAEHLLEEEERGTRLRLIFEGRPVNLVARLFAPLGLLFRGGLRRQLEADLADLKRAAEQRHRDLSTTASG